MIIKLEYSGSAHVVRRVHVCAFRNVFLTLVHSLRECERTDEIEDEGSETVFSTLSSRGSWRYHVPSYAMNELPYLPGTERVHVVLSDESTLTCELVGSIVR